MRRPGPPREIPPPLELECLRALWALGEASVHDVRNWLGQNRPLAYTTVMTLLDRLVKRGAATRRKQGRPYLYQAKVSREALREIAVRQVCNLFFDGSREGLGEYLRTSGASLNAPLDPGGASELPAG